MKIIIIILILLSKTVYSEIFNIDNERLKELIKQNIAIIDVRTEQEWKKTGVISHSYLISMIDDNGKYSLENWYRNFSKIKLKNNSVILICAVGGRSGYLAKLLNRVNHKLHIYNLNKGIQDWISNKNPVILYKSK